MELFSFLYAFFTYGIPKSCEKLRIISGSGFALLVDRNAMSASLCLTLVGYAAAALTIFKPFLKQREPWSMVSD